MNIFSPSNSVSMSDDIRQIAQAFAQAKQSFVATGFGGLNKHQNYKYAKIEDIYDAVESALLKNNIIIWHYARPIDGKECLFTRLIHFLSGQYIEDVRILESEKPGNQGKGIANTYMRKQAVLSLCAIAQEEDDDGEDEQKYIEERDGVELITEDQLKYLQKEIKSTSNGATLHANILKFNGIKELSQLRASAFSSVRSYIAKNKEALDKHIKEVLSQ